MSQSNTGVWGRSSENGFKSLVIFALDDADDMCLVELYLQKNRAAYTTAVGGYTHDNGDFVTEPVIIAVQCPTVEWLLDIFADEQESVLHLSPFGIDGENRRASLVMQDGEVRDLGHMMQVSKDEAMRSVGWTMTTHTNPDGETYETYWVAK